LEVIRVVFAEATRLLRPAGLLCVEHADVQGESAQQVLVQHGAYAGVRDHRDLTGRSRFVTGIRRAR
jgi:release factor glutamine methyltransferase